MGQESSVSSGKQAFETLQSSNTENEKNTITSVKVHGKPSVQVQK